jgi:hypothetical protein
MLLFPLVHVTIEGAGYPRLTIQMLSADGAFNVFALILLLVPILGIAIEMLAPRAWRIGGAALALLGIIMVPLAVFWLNRGLRDELGSLENVSMGPGAYILLLGYVLLFLVIGTTEFRWYRHHHHPHVAHRM